MAVSILARTRKQPYGFKHALAVTCLKLTRSRTRSWATFKNALWEARLPSPFAAFLRGRFLSWACVLRKHYRQIACSVRELPCFARNLPARSLLSVMVRQKPGSDNSRAWDSLTVARKVPKESTQDWNQQLRVQGTTDINLNERGRLQAQMPFG